MLFILAKEVYLHLDKLNKKIQRLAFKPYYSANSSNELDDMMMMPEITLPYFKFEIILGLLFNLVVTIPMSLFLFNNFEYAFTCDKSLAIWAVAIAGLQNFQIPLKIMILLKLSEIYLADKRVAVRRLLLIIRSRIIVFNKCLSFLVYLIYLFGMLKLWKAESCYSKGPVFYNLCLAMSLCFILRVLLSYIFFSIYINNPIEEETPDIDVLRGATSNEKAQISKYILTETNMNDLRINEKNCIICFENFMVGNSISIMPCHNSHIYHVHCIDKWLSAEKTCPICMVPLKKALKLAAH